MQQIFIRNLFNPFNHDIGMFEKFSSDLNIDSYSRGLNVHVGEPNRERIFSVLHWKKEQLIDA